MSAGILMRSGSLEIMGDAGRNAGVLMRGGRLVVLGRCDDFTAAEMRGGEIFVAGDAGGFICAKMTGGAIYAPKGRPIPPAGGRPVRGDEAALVSKVLGVSSFSAMTYRRFGP